MVWAISCAELTQPLGEQCPQCGSILVPGTELGVPQAPGVGTSFPFSQMSERGLGDEESLPEAMQPASAGLGTEPRPLTRERPHGCPVLNGEGGLWTRGGKWSLLHGCGVLISQKRLAVVTPSPSVACQDGKKAGSQYGANFLPVREGVRSCSGNRQP